MRFLKTTLFAFIIVAVASFANKAMANHIYGADFNYTWVTGNTYTITLTIYGDCGNTTGSFAGLNGATPKIYIFNNLLLKDSINLVQQGVGVEVTPVCPAQANQTVCTLPVSSIRGVKRFIYSRNYTLSGLSANWMFQFNGDLPSSSGSFVAGRSTNINNIVTAPNPIMRLEATLNNTVGNNSSPVYTTIPTPFFCVNKPANYNPGTVDANGDALSFALVDALVATPPGGTVTYVLPYTATAPLATVPTTFAFNPANGQLDFTPSITINSLVVSRVTETRGSVVVGTSMREMTFIIVACNNNPPGGNISNPSPGVTLVNGTSMTICKEKGPFTFSINPTDVDGDIINMAFAGLPAGAVFTINNNNTTAPTGTFSWNVSGVTPGVYNFFVTYTDQGCPLSSKQTLAYTITVLPNPAVTYNLVTPPTCFSKAVFHLTPSGGTSPYTITFGTVTRSGVTGQITDSLNPGTYTFTITGSNGCSHDTTLTIASPAAIVPAAGVKKSTCSTLANGSVTLSASNSTPPYTFALGTGPYSAANVFSPLAAGTYTFHVKDGPGCIKDTTITIADSLNIIGNVVVTNALCFNQASGALNVTGAGGVNPYTFALDAGAYGAGGSYTGLNAGPYVLHIKDNLGCIKDTSVAVAQPTIIVPGALVSNVKCFGNSDASITMSATGGTPAYTYAMDAGTYSATNVFSGLPIGTYVMHVKDANGCIHDTSITITQPAVLGFTFVVTNVLCNGQSNGTVTVNATGGTTPYSYAADAGAFGASNVLTGLSIGSHTIHLKDANNCIKDSVINITQPAVLGIGVVAVDPSCNAGTNGTITVNGTGGTTPYTYALDAGPFVVTSLFTGLSAGTYAVHLKDANGCTKDTTATLSEPTAITVAAGVKRPRCTPLVNGIVTLTAGGGTPGYTYAVGASAYNGSPVFNGLASGTYIFHVKDAKNCIKDTTITVTDSVFVHATVAMTPTNCFGDANGSLNITPSGGDVPYTFALNTNPYSATNPIINLLAATYVLHVKDSNGCRLDTNVVVTEPTIVVPVVVITQPLCFDSSNGVIALTGSGGTPGYTYALGTGAYNASGTFNNMHAGTYALHVKDSHGCIHDTTVTVGQPTPIAYTLLYRSNVKCFGDSSGYVRVKAQGGTPPYTFSVDSKPYQSADTVRNITAGAHTVHIQDANGCIKDSIINLSQPPQAFVLVTDVITPTCEGYKDGTIRILGTGGTPGYRYSDDNTVFDTQKVYTMLPEGNYTFYVKDNNGCVVDTNFDLIGYPHINIAGATVTDVSCFGFSDGAFSLNVTGGNQPFTYTMVSPRDTNLTGIFDSLKRASYTVRITDSTACFKDTTVVVNQPPLLEVSTVITPNDCEGLDQGGGVKAIITGGTSPYFRVWSTNATTDSIVGLPNGKYVVYVMDAHSCKDTAAGIVEYDNCCKPYIPNAFTPNNDQRNDIYRVKFKGDVKLENFSIFNRFGQRMFYTTEVDKGWDGTYNDKPQDVGTYFYYIKLICGNKGDNELEFKGDVTLIR